VLVQVGDMLRSRLRSFWRQASHDEHWCITELACIRTCDKSTFGVLYTCCSFTPPTNTNNRIVGLRCILAAVAKQDLHWAGPQRYQLFGNGGSYAPTSFSPLLPAIGLPLLRFLL